MGKKESETDLAKTQAGALAIMDFQADAGAGFEDADNESFALPFLRILQKLSPQCDSDKAEYIEGAKPGQILNSVSLERSDNMLVVPAYYKRAFTMWTPREEGGGFLGQMEVGDPRVDQAERKENVGGGKLVHPDGFHIVDTRYFFVIDVKTAAPGLITMSSTQIKKAKAWLSMASNLKIGEGSAQFQAPLFSHIYSLSTITESKGEDTWKNWKIELVSQIKEEEANLYLAAKNLRDQVKSGTATVNEGEDDLAF